MSALLVAALVLAACGGDDSAAPSERDSSDAATADADQASDDQPSDDQPSDDQPSDDQPSDDQPSDDQPSDEEAGDDQADADDGGDDGGGTVVVSGVDWATVDLTTIDWANIDMDDLDLVAIGDNPTVANISEADLAVIQERMAARFGSGAVTLTIADQTWELEGFQCAFESSGVLNEGTTMGTNLFDEIDGVRIQMQIDVYDDGAAQFTMDDIDDFENPSFSYLETTDIEVTVDGNTVRAEGDVTDQASATFDVVPMTFEGECGPDSLR